MHYLLIKKFFLLPAACSLEGHFSLSPCSLFLATCSLSPASISPALCSPLSYCFRERMAYRIEYITKLAYPTCFLFFNLLYWSYYLNFYFSSKDLYRV